MAEKVIDVSRKLFNKIILFNDTEVVTLDEIEDEKKRWEILYECCRDPSLREFIRLQLSGLVDNSLKQTLLEYVKNVKNLTLKSLILRVLECYKVV